jgi:hyperosmotically inducible periplasmic protein
MERKFRIFAITAVFFAISFCAAGLWAATAPASTRHSDDAITKSVEMKFAKDADLKSLDLNVTTVDGAVTLSGKVPTQAVADRAVQLAQDTQHVKTVVSELEVGKKETVSGTVHKVEEKTKETIHKAGTAIEDTTITAEVKLKFAKDDVVKGSSIDVDTDSGIVTLSGIVATKAEADRAIVLARSVGGVKGVHSKLIVQS